MKVLIIGDSFRVETGYGRINQSAVEAFRSQGYEIAEVAGQIRETPEPDDVKTYMPKDVDANPLGLESIEGAIQDFKPDLLYASCDPGSLTALSTVVPKEQPFLAYVVVEGEPLLNRRWLQVLANTPIFACSAYGAKVIKDYVGKEVPWVYHGINPEFTSEPRFNGMREELRKALGWTDKFVVIDVAQNVRRKQIPRLIEAMSILKNQYKQKDLVLYLHTVPYQGYWLEGHDLAEVNYQFGLTNMELPVVFHPNMSTRYAAIPLRTNDVNDPGLVELMAASDLFVNPSQVEGFGLPAAEAMATGLPVLVTKYAAGWEVVQGAGVGLTADDWEIHKSGTKYANVFPQHIAKEILNLRRDPKGLARMSAAGIERAKLFNWDNYKKMLIEQVEATINGDQERNNTDEAATTES